MAQALQTKIKSIVMIPGSGEFVYSPKIVIGSNNKPLNANSDNKKSNLILSIEQLKHDFPNLKNVSLVVGWFTNSTEAKDILITPKAESRASTSENWEVAGYTRDNANLVSKVNGSLNWGGTSNDKSVIEACELLKTNGYNVTLYPMLFIDLPDKPWRGYIKADSDQEVEQFFEQYNKFITHYASLERQDKKLKNYLDGFIIGSEFRDLLSYKNNEDRFLAVEKLVHLAKEVKSIVGDEIKLTYAANWDEYHHTDNGWYHLDELWASSDISYVGINAYFPLTDNLPQEKINYTLIKQGWESGEYYNYIKDEKGKPKPIAAKWATKNIEYWWKHHHYNPNGKITAWKPKMKPVIFTEFGFPSIDGCSNQPNAYIDFKQDNIKLPTGSKGKVDYKAQQTAIEATLDFWENKSSLPGNNGLVGADGAFLYAVDARHQFYNHPESYSDADNYNYGHWVKLESSDVMKENHSIIIGSILLIIIGAFILVWAKRANNYKVKILK